MKIKKKQLAAQGLAMLLALGVGILIGAKSCSKVEREYLVPEKSAPIIQEKIVYQCPPEPQLEPKPVLVKKSKKDQSLLKKKKKHKKLPKESKIDPSKRKRLLAFVRAKSKATLPLCRGSRKEVYRITVKLFPKENGSVRRIVINAPPGEVPNQVRTCLRSRMKRWVLPVKDIQKDQPIIWGLTL